ncbi:MAG: signal peptidase [Acidobacteriota bacterium]|nr:signal peptidase [Acidobacteriota bacterium]
MRNPITRFTPHGNPPAYAGGSDPKGNPHITEPQPYHFLPIGLFPFSFRIPLCTMFRMARKSSTADKARSKSAPEETSSGTSKGKKEDAGPPQPGPRKSVWREYFESAIYTAVMFVFFITFIGRTVGVPTGSMQNTIVIGDHFLINKFIFAPGSHPFFLPQRDVKRGDIIVFKYPGDRYNPGRDTSSRPPVTPFRDYFIKRVIGLPGETIEVRGADVLIDGRVLPEHRVTGGMGANEKAALDILNVPPRAPDQPYTVYYRAPTLAATPDNPERPLEIFHFAVEKPYTIPANSYFVMGDNRDDSVDSRAWGPVDADLVVGRALFVFWSNDESLPSGNFLIDFLFRKTRWSRTGTMIK